MLEAWSVAVKVSLINNVSSGLTAISRHFAATHTDAKKLQSQLEKIKLLGITGAAIGGAGFMGLSIIEKMLKPASEYSHQLALMNTSGMKHLEIVKDTQAAWAATKAVPTESVMSNLEAIRDLRMVFGNTEHATEYMPTLQKVNSVLGILRHGTPGGAKAEAYELAKALEMKGAVRTPELFTTQADLMTKALVASGGKVNASDFLSAYKYGRAATSGWNDDFSYKILPTLIQEMKGGGGSASGGPGSALMSAYATVVGGVVPQKSLQLWERLHMLDSSKVVWTKDGHAKGVRPGGILGNEAFQQNPYAWTQQFLIPALQKAGYTTEAQQKQALQYLFPNRTAGFVMGQFATQAWKFERDRKLITGAQGIAGYDELVKNDPMMARMALEKQWEGLLAIMGYQIMPQVISGTLKLMTGVRSLAELYSKHSTTAKILMWSFIGLSAAMAFSGTLITLTAGFRAMALVTPLLSSALGGAGLAGKLAGQAGLVIAAGAAGYAIGNLVNKLFGIENGELGAWIYDKTHGSEPDVAGWKGNTFVGLPKQTVVHTNVHIDGRQVAKVVTKHMDGAAAQPQGGMSSFDGSMHAPYPAY